MKILAFVIASPVLLSLLLLGCGDPRPVISNDVIISETKKCEEAGLYARTKHKYDNPRADVIGVSCVPKKPPASGAVELLLGTKK